MKRQRILTLLIILIILMTLTGCNAQFRIRRNNDIDFSLTVHPEDVLAYLDSTQFDWKDAGRRRLVQEYFDEQDLHGDIRVLSTRSRTDEYRLKLRITPSKDVEDAVHSDGIAVGRFLDIFEAVSQKDWQDARDDLLTAVDQGEHYALDRRGNPMTVKKLERTLDRGYFREYKAAYVAIVPGDTLWTFPGSIKMVITDVRRDIDFKAANRIEIQDGVDAIIVYQDSSAGPALLIALIIAILGVGGYYVYTRFIRNRHEYKF